MNNLSLILLTKNEAKNIKEWGGWLKKLTKVNELIVIDDLSTDTTKKEAKKLAGKKLQVKIFDRSLNNNFSAQRQFAVEQAVNDWILWLDGDEKPSDDLIEFINHIDTNQLYNYAFRRSDIFLGEPLHHGETASQYFLRLFHRRHGYFSGTVHELWVSSLPTISEKYEILHRSHSTLQTFFEKINFYSDIRARELFDSKIKSGLFQIIFYPTGKFIHNYLFRLGFLDGTRGIILALGMSLHSFLVRAKLWTYYHP